MARPLLPHTSAKNVEKLLSLHKRLIQELNSRSNELFVFNSSYKVFSYSHNEGAKFYSEFQEILGGFYHFRIIESGNKKFFCNFSIRTEDLLREDYLSYARERKLSREAENKATLEKWAKESSRQG